MTTAQFDAWLTHMGLSERRAAELLGVAPSTIGQWRRVSTPPLLGLACAALAAGLKPWVPRRTPSHACGAGVEGAAQVTALRACTAPESGGGFFDQTHAL